MTLFKPTKGFKINIYGTMGIILFFSVWVMITGIALHRPIGIILMVLIIDSLLLPIYWLIPFGTVGIDNEQIIFKKYFWKKYIRWEDIREIQEQSGIEPFMFFGNYILIKGKNKSIKFASKIERFPELIKEIWSHANVQSWPIQEKKPFKNKYKKY